MLAHVAPGEMVVPPVLSPETQETIKQEMIAVGLDPNQYTVGDGMSINPITGMAEFGFLKKLGKSLKKVVKKVAPIALPLLIPGVGNVLGGALSSVGSALGIPSGIGSSLLGGKGILGTAEAIRGGIAGIGSNLFGGRQQDVMYQDQFGNVVSADEYANMNEADKILYNQMNNQQVGPLGTPVGPFLRNTFLGTTEDPGLLRNIVSGDKDSTFMGVNPGLAALAALYGKAVKEDFKKKEGGLKDIRQSIRPDLMPAPTFTGFDLGIRPGMSYGGRIDEQELDLRMGGPSIGPGTGTSDDIPAMLSDGEFVMTSSANNGLGGFKITKTETGIELIPNGAPDRQKGAKNMDKLMKTFEKFNEIGKV
jgi:hypothetical protein